MFAFLPSGPPTLGFVKAYNENGLKEAGIKFYATGDLTQESDLPALGDGALGLQTTFHYAVSHDSPENKAFVEAAKKAIGNPAELSFPAVGAFDGMHVIYKMIEATGGEQDAAEGGRCRQGPVLGQPARPGLDRPREPSHHAEHLSARSRQGRGRHLLQQGDQDLREAGRSRAGGG